MFYIIFRILIIKNADNIIIMNEAEYLNFAHDMNQNISNLIHLCNNIRYNVFNLRRQQTITPPPPVNAPLNIPLVRRNRRFPQRRTRARRQTNTVSRTTLSGRRGPSRAVINNAVERLVFRDISTNFTICPITRNRFNEDDSIMRIRQCRHIFSESALEQWFQTSHECPVCRYNISGNNTRDSLDSPYVNRIFNDILSQLNESSTDGSGNSFIEYSFSYA